MNLPPADARFVPAAALRHFIAAVFAASEMPVSQADFLADLLTTNDLRGVFSHGTRQTADYTAHFRAGRLTPHATVTTLQETATTLVLDGGGGLGYFPCHEAVTRLLPKAKQNGLAVATTRNHGHFGAAGIYARGAVAQGLFGFVTSGHQLYLQPDQFVMRAAGGSPMAFGIPTGEEPPFVLDFGASQDLYIGPDAMRPLLEIAPSTVLRSFGLGCACQALGGLLCGVPLRPENATREWSGADQGSFMIVVDLAALYPQEPFLKEMDEYARAVRQMTPFPGMTEACLPGTIEWEREQQFGQAGIPISPKHGEILLTLAKEYGLECPVVSVP